MEGKEEDNRVHPVEERAWAAAVAWALEAIVSARAVDTKRPMKGELLALKSNVRIVVRI